MINTKFATILISLFSIFTISCKDVAKEVSEIKRSDEEEPPIHTWLRYQPYTQVIDNNDSLLFLFQYDCITTERLSWSFSVRSDYIDSFVIVRLHTGTVFTDNRKKNNKMNVDDLYYYEGYSGRIYKKDWFTIFNLINSKYQTVEENPEDDVPDYTCYYYVYINGRSIKDTRSTRAFINYVDSLLWTTTIKDLYFSIKP